MKTTTRHAEVCMTKLYEVIARLIINTNIKALRIVLRFNDKLPVIHLNHHYQIEKKSTNCKTKLNGCFLPLSKASSELNLLQDHVITAPPRGLQLGITHLSSQAIPFIPHHKCKDSLT